MTIRTHIEYIRKDLYDYMSELSEDYWCASWLMSLEWTLWEHLRATNGGDWNIPKEKLNHLRELYQAAGGWWVWRDTDKDPVFLTNEEWQDLIIEKEINCVDSEASS